jgi:hypothetical protein
MNSLQYEFPLLRSVNDCFCNHYYCYEYYHQEKHHYHTSLILTWRLTHNSNIFEQLLLFNVVVLTNIRKSNRQGSAGIAQSVQRWASSCTAGFDVR